MSTAHILTDIAVKKNEQLDVSIICGPSGYESSYNYHQREINKKIIIYRVKLPVLNKNILLKRVFRLLLLTVKLSWNVLTKVKKGDTVLFTTNPTFLVLILPFIRKIKGFNLELLVHDVFPDNLVPAGLIKQNSFKFKLLSSVYIRSYKNVDRIIVLGQDMSNVMLEKIGKVTSRIDIIPNWSDADIYPIKNFSIAEYLGLDIREKVVLSFAGNLGRVQGLLKFIDIVKMANNKNLILVITGDGALRKLITNKINNENIENVFYLGPKPRVEQKLFLNACHIGLVTLVSGMKGLGVPSKTYNYLATGKAILFIGDKESEVDNYITNYDCGWSFSWDEQNNLIDFIRELSFSQINEIVNKGEKAFHLSGNFKKEKLLNLF